MHNRTLNQRLEILEAASQNRHKGYWVMVQEQDVSIEAAKQRVLKELGIAEFPKDEFGIIFDIYGK